MSRKRPHDDPGYALLLSLPGAALLVVINVVAMTRDGARVWNWASLVCVTFVVCVLLVKWSRHP